ncbi:MAG: translation initiation factor eIF-1A [Candidatus Ranarchaeia archaeon]
MPKQKNSQRNKGPVVSEIQRVRLPREKEGEVLAVVVQMLGFDRVKAKCMDGYTRVCRIRGKMKKRVWIRPNDIIIVVPWDFQTEQKADIIWRYSRGEADYLRRKGYIKE